MSGVLGGVIGGIGSIVGSAISADAQRQANDMNLKIARENNAAMLSAMREQTKSEQEYNSISAQMQRAMAAGANPMLLAGADPTSASSAGVPSLDTPVMQNPYQSFASLGANVGSAALQAEQIALQEKQINVAEFKSKIDMLQTIGELGGSVDWSSDELKGVIRAVFGNTFDTGAIGTFARDNMVTTRIKNTIELSNLDVAEKKYLYGWLDEFTNAQFMSILAQTEQTQTQSGVNRSTVSVNETVKKVNNSIADLNAEKKKEVTQAIKNMREQWTSLNATAQMDVIKLEKFAKFFDSQINKLTAEIANLNKVTEVKGQEYELIKNEVTYWTWHQLLQHGSQITKTGHIFDTVLEYNRPDKSSTPN